MGEGQKPKAPAVKREAEEFRRNGPRIDHSYHIDTELAFHVEPPLRFIGDAHSEHESNTHIGEDK